MVIDEYFIGYYIGGYFVIRYWCLLMAIGGYSIINH
jgi:hypothetical protein